MDEISNDDRRLPAGPIDLAALGISEQQAADLRFRLSTFCEDWDRPEMDVYDDEPNSDN